MIQITPLVKNLIIINIVVYFSVTYIFPNWIDYFMAYYPASHYFKPIQIVTHMFMHGNLIPHLFFNMFMLYMFGTVLEYIWGERFLLFFYFMSGFGAIGLHYLVKYISLQYYYGEVDPMAIEQVLSQGREIIYQGKNYINELGQINSIINVPAVGASGAVMGVLAGFGVMYPRRKLMLIFPPIELEARIFIPILIAFELFMGLGASDGVAHFAHIGGAITGFFLARNRHKFSF